jgi:acetyl esterase/lipase
MLIILFFLIIVACSICALIASLIILFQEYRIFPSIIIGKTDQKLREKVFASITVESFFIEPAKGVRLEVWCVRPNRELSNGKVVVFFHGNKDTVDTFFTSQELFSNLGYTTYSYDYRGAGLSRGRLSLEGVLADGLYLVEYVAEKEKCSKKSIILTGQSIGTGIASWCAKQTNPELLILYSPYTSLKDVILQRPLFKYLAAFTRYNFLTLDYLMCYLESSSKNSKIVIVDSLVDTVILPSHSVDLVTSLNDSRILRVTLENSTHQNLLFDSFDELKKNIL